MSSVTAPRVEMPSVLRSRVARLGAHVETLLGVAGVLVGANGVALAYRWADTSTGQGHFALFWVSFGLALVSLLALALRARSDIGRVSALVGFGLVTFVPKFVMTLDGPRYFDEYGHWRHVNDIVAKGHLLVPTPYQPIQRVYPGLQAVTALLHWTVRMPTWHAGQLVVGLAHCAVLVVIWWMARMLGLPNRAAVVAAFLYGLNPSFLYFDTQFGYESLALPLAFTAVALTMAVRRAGTPRAARVYTILALATAAACIVTHHSSTFVMLGLMVLVAAFVPTVAGRERDADVRWLPWVIAAVSGGAALLWMTTVASPTYDYLEPHVRSWLTDAGDLLRGRSRRTLDNGATINTSRRLFAGSGLPVYEIVFAFVAPLLALGAVLASVRDHRRDRVDGRRRLRLLGPFYGLVVLYLVSLPLALTATGGETAHRAWGYAYLGVAIVVASAVHQWDELMARLPERRVIVAGVAALLVVAIGNTAAGANVYYRFPGPDTFGTDTRSRTVELDHLATWMDRQLPDGSKVVTDRFTALAVVGYSDLRVPTPSDYLVYRLFREAGTPTPRLRAYLRDHHFRYFVLDRRLGHLEPKQRPFPGYIGKQSVDAGALAEVGSTPFLRIVHRTPTYLVLRINP